MLVVLARHLHAPAGASEGFNRCGNWGQNSVTAAGGDLGVAPIHRPAPLKAHLFKCDTSHAVASFGGEPHTFNDVVHECAVNAFSTKTSRPSKRVTCFPIVWRRLPMTVIAKKMRKWRFSELLPLCCKTGLFTSACFTYAPASKNQD